MAADTKVLPYTLLQDDSSYSPNPQSKSQINKIPLINNSFSSNNHSRETSYSLEFRVKMDGCTNYDHIIFHTPLTRDAELRNKMLWWLNNPIPDTSRNNNHYLYPEDTREHIEPESLSLDTQIEYIPPYHKENKKDRSALKVKGKDSKVEPFCYVSKLRGWVDRSSCSVQIWTLSTKNIGTEGGPSKKDKESIMKKKDDGYIW